MSCGGCATRRTAIVNGAIAIAEGRSADALAEARRFVQSAEDDATRLAEATARAARRVREQATARLGIGRR